MRLFCTLVLTGVLLLLCNSCTSPQTQTATVSQAEYRPTATVKDIMDSMVDPGSDYIWDAVETVVSAKGIELAGRS
jgi:hypothetical protein